MRRFQHGFGNGRIGAALHQAILLDSAQLLSAGMAVVWGNFDEGGGI
jgi:hypothetical protein